MKKKIADQWVKALRSGKYKQGRGFLNADGEFCCLGVLCELAAKKGLVRKKHKDTINNIVYYDYEDAILPTRVQEWASILHSNGEFTDSNKRTRSLADLNDAGRSFKQIANIIEKNYEKL